MIVRKELRASFSMPPKVKRLIFLHQYPVNGLKQSTIILSFITGIEQSLSLRMYIKKWHFGEKSSYTKKIMPQNQCSLKMDWNYQERISFSSTASIILLKTFNVSPRHRYQWVDKNIFNKKDTNGAVRKCTLDLFVTQI